MKLRYRHLHIVLILGWMSLALVIAMKTALLGNEQAALGKQRGADAKRRTELANQKDRLHAELDWRSSAPSLAEALKRLDLPLQPSTAPVQPPMAMARVDHSAR